MQTERLSDRPIRPECKYLLEKIEERANDNKKMMEAFHSRLDQLVESIKTAQIIMQQVKEFGDKMISIVYGNGKVGLVTRVSNNSIKIGILLWLFGIIIGVLGFLIKNSLVK